MASMMMKMMKAASGKVVKNPRPTTKGAAKKLSMSKQKSKGKK